MVVLIGQVDFGANQCDIELVIDEALSNSCVQDRSFVARICANQEEQVRIFDRSYASVHYIIASQVSSKIRNLKMNMERS